MMTAMITFAAEGRRRISRGARILVIAVILGAGGMSSVDAEWESAWLVPAAMGDYEDIYIFSLDLRDLKYEVYDEDERDFISEKFPSEALEEAANDFYFRIQNRLAGILPVNPAQEIDPAKRSLVMELKLSALFQAEDRGKIMELIAGKPQKSVPVTFEGTVKDSRTQQVVLTFKDTQLFEWEESAAPVASEAQQEQMSVILDIWARKIAADLARRKLDS